MRACVAATTWSALAILRARLATASKAKAVARATTLPHRIEYTNPLPRDPNGKLYRRMLV